MKIIYAWIILLSCLVATDVQAMASTRESPMTDKINVELKLLNGNNLPEFIKGTQAISELNKYLFIKIVNKDKVNAFFKLKVWSNHSSIKEEFQFNLIPPNEVPVYYLYYIGGPASFAPEAADGGYDLNYQIEDLQFQY